jgi:hypothetical protein
MTGSHCFYAVLRLDVRLEEHLETNMEPSGIEPLTSCVQGRRSPS